MKRTLLGLGIAAFALGTLACTTDGPSGTRNLPAYITSDTCAAYSEPGACDTAPSGTCAWAAVEADCAPGADCPTGVCATLDPCSAHSDQVSCLADLSSGCSWAVADRLCPAGAICPEEGAGGFCYGPVDDCICACPLYCPEGADCPPCACDCSNTGGGTCTCACPACEPGAECPPCDCNCTDDGCVDDGVCTCACPACPEGEPDCGPCECTCSGSSGGSAGTGTASCVCPDCEPDTECPPCECEVPEGTEDPCLAFVNEADCLADLTGSCTWIAIGEPCDASAIDCRSGVCQGVFIDDDCGCVCPACMPGETCPPCVCDCGSGTGTGCVPGGEEPAEPPIEPR